MGTPRRNTTLRRTNGRSPQRKRGRIRRGTKERERVGLCGKGTASTWETPAARRQRRGHRQFRVRTKEERAAKRSASAALPVGDRRRVFFPRSCSGGIRESYTFRHSRSVLAFPRWCCCNREIPSRASFRHGNATPGPTRGRPSRRSSRYIAAGGACPRLILGWQKRFKLCFTLLPLDLKQPQRVRTDHQRRAGVRQDGQPETRSGTQALAMMAIQWQEWITLRSKRLNPNPPLRSIKSRFNHEWTRIKHESVSTQRPGGAKKLNHG